MLIVFLGVCFAAAGIGGMFTASSVDDWYTQLNKPSFTPPGWVIGTVWNVLYTAMAVAAWRVWRRAGLADARLAMAAFAVQLVLNVAWSWLFFGHRSPGTAMIELVALEAAIVTTMLLFFRHDRIAGWLMAPYAGWVAFAGVLNFMIWRMN